ncbi:hypothetical protein GSI_12282 [Ganoderma sinense ZZ0214-1]|uniref:BTB domain-containing protein n=1 Tax=Ganoderma sinense ZZ0214-1 TaxID=1077348 RepID=A0A2G8RYG0_9APHY|nr:hypothetical protein GSI_12282 [Ganoderma sinense ZZ0214-1]
MAEASRSTKRRRSSATAKSIVILEPGESCNPAKGQETFTRDAHFWLEDGNLILLAGTTAFRVYRGILVKKSAVFADMFDTGSLDATETFDGCPVVRLPDHPEDPRDFFQYLIPCFPLPVLLEGVPVPASVFARLHAALHLAHKYQCPEVETRALFTLKKFYTANFTQYDVFDSTEFAFIRPQPEDSVAAVNIARLTQTPSMLPYALYLAATLEGEMMDGYKRRDGSVEHLSAEDLRRCIDARGPLAREHAAVIRHVFRATFRAPGCRTPSACAAMENVMLHDVEENALGRFNVLQSYVEAIEEWVLGGGLCKLCKTAMLARDVEARRRVWSLLPGMFGLTTKECGFEDEDEDNAE